MEREGDALCFLTMYLHHLLSLFEFPVKVLITILKWVRFQQIFLLNADKEFQPKISKIFSPYFFSPKMLQGILKQKSPLNEVFFLLEKILPDLPYNTAYSASERIKLNLKFPGC